MNDIIYSWNFNDNKNRGNLWYVIAFSVVIGLIVWWFLTKQYVMSFLVILVSGVSLFIENNTEENIVVLLTTLWIKVNNSFYDYPKINSFTIIYDWDKAVILRLDIMKKWIRFIDLNIDNEIALNLREILPNFIKEDENWELNSIDRLIKYLKL